MTDDELLDAIRRFAETTDVPELDLDAIRRCASDNRATWRLVTNDGQTLDECQADTLGVAVEQLAPVWCAERGWSALIIDLRYGLTPLGARLTDNLTVICGRR